MTLQVYDAILRYNFDNKRLRPAFDHWIRDLANDHRGLDLGEMFSLTRLPDGLRVRQDLFLNYCSSLVRLPLDLQVGGSLDLTDCVSLIDLSEGLMVLGDLYLNGCTALVSLPKRLSVSGNIFVDGCIQWDGFIPEDAEIGGDVCKQSWVADD